MSKHLPNSSNKSLFIDKREKLKPREVKPLTNSRDRLGLDSLVRAPYNPFKQVREVSLRKVNEFWCADGVTGFRKLSGLSS